MILLVLACVLFLLAAILAAVKITWKIESTVVEDLPAANAPFAAAGNAKVTHSSLNVSKSLDVNAPAGTNTTVTAQGKVTMVAGAGTLNLAAAPGTAGVVDLTGLKLRTILFHAAVANANPITVAIGAANGYTGLGAAFSLTLDPGKSQGVEPNATAVAAGVRLFDITGTGAQELEFIITAGNN